MRHFKSWLDTFVVWIFRIVFVDAGVAQIDIETKKMKEEQKMKEAQDQNKAIGILERRKTGVWSRTPK